MKSKLIVATGLIGATLLLGAGAASAGVSTHIHIGVPGVHVQPAPVLVHARPVHAEPRRVYRAAPQPVRVVRHPHGGWHANHHAPQRGYAYRDRDRDGRPNYADRDRDGDGVRNRFDRRPDNPYRY